MARYKYIDTSPRFLPVDLARGTPLTFEHVQIEQGCEVGVPEVNSLNPLH